ncbi:MAG TPA: hypothetical protein VHH34_04455 [Pseudonocardiaceae bacterium]|nr:hypothetical protein [Pseudonocardiaceae bacterium]
MGELRRRHVPRVLLSEGTEPETTAGPADLDGALAGTAASGQLVTVDGAAGLVRLNEDEAGESATQATAAWAASK